MSANVKRVFGLSGRRWREAITGYVFVSPFVVGFLWFTALPMAIAVYLAFTKYEIVSPPEWVGLANFAKLFRDERLRHSLANTAFYAGISVPLNLVVAFAAALAMNMKIRGIRLYRTMFYLPSLTPAIANAMLWLWIFNPKWGLANQFIGLLGIPQQSWFLDPQLAKLCLIFMGMWGIGPTMVIYLAGLQGVPETLYEAAEIDGAGRWARFWHVTVPILSPVTFFNLIMGIIGAFQIFTTAYVLVHTGAGGESTASAAGVLDSLLFYVYYLWQNAFAFWRMGYAAAQGWLLLFIILILTAIQFRLAGQWVHYEAERSA
jgi:multiple sugar transport system permease protein